MIIMHNFGDGERVTDVYVAELADGTYSVKWNTSSKSFLPRRQMKLFEKTCAGVRKQFRHGVIEIVFPSILKRNTSW